MSFKVLVGVAGVRSQSARIPGRFRAVQVICHSASLHIRSPTTTRAQNTAERKAEKKTISISDLYIYIVAVSIKHEGAYGTVVRVCSV